MLKKIEKKKKEKTVEISTVFSFHNLPIEKDWLDWNKKFGRNTLPWHSNKTMYSIWISEVMLQQTRVETVVDCYNRWMKKFPNIEILANSEESEILAEWSGMGYYTRAKNIHKGAKFIQNWIFENKDFPQTEEEWLLVPGVGKSTARAILSQSETSYLPIMDGNVKRWLNRYVGKILSDKESWVVLNQIMPNVKKENAPSVIQTQMDIGNMICLPKSTKCEMCLLNENCASKGPSEWKTKKEKKIKPIIEMFVDYVEIKNGIYLENREDSGIWNSLFFLPESVQKNKENCVLFEHELTHRSLKIYVKKEKSVENKEFIFKKVWISYKKVNTIGRPSILDKIIYKMSGEKIVRS